MLRRPFTRAPLENAMLALLRGSRYGGFATRFIPGPHLYADGSRRSVTRSGIRYDLDVSCLMQWYVYWDFREKPRERLYSMVREDDAVLDVGTNIGETLLNFARLVGPAGHVYGFEPDEVNYRNVERNIALNVLSNVTVFKLGVSDKKETVRLFRVDPHNLGMNRILSAEEAARFSDHTTIETDTLDNIVAQKSIGRVDLIKIDIEGYEMHALRGARRLLETQRPKLFVEVGYTRLLKNGTSPAGLIVFLEELGYEVRHAETDEIVGRDFDFTPLGDGGIDIYAVPRDR